MNTISVIIGIDGAPEYSSVTENFKSLVVYPDQRLSVSLVFNSTAAIDKWIKELTIRSAEMKLSLELAKSDNEF